MSELIGPNYLITARAGVDIYRDIQELPLLDPHNHADVREIRLNQNYTDIWQIEGATDHYVWELLRKRGVPEELITGDAANEEKWRAAAAVWEELAGNPTYEWVQLDLKRILGIDEPISAESADLIWRETKAALQRPELRPQALLKRMNVESMCSTDDPTDSLEDHQALADSPIAGMIRPTFRPDRAMNIFKPDWREYIAKLEARVNLKFSTVRDLIAALKITHDYFAENGCLASDHGLKVPYGYQVDEADADGAFRKAQAGRELEPNQIAAFMAFVLNEIAEMDSAKDWVFQIHMGVVRDVRHSLFAKLGPDAGGDISDHMVPIVEPLTPLLNRFDGRLKIVLYSLEPYHQATLATLARVFGDKVNLGAAWWYNDSPGGMKRQLEYIASVDLLANFAGMVADSRKLLSYASRHEMFRRCLADVLGAMVDQGRVPMNVAVKLARRIAYDHPKSFWGFSA